MPPEKIKKILSEDEIALIKKWINNGAEYETYWAFVPPKETPSSVSKYNHPIDNYLFAKQKDQHLKREEQAVPIAQLRRLAYKIVGLPPTIDEIEKNYPLGIERA